MTNFPRPKGTHRRPTSAAEPSYFVKNLVAARQPYFKAFDYPSEAALNSEILETLAAFGAGSRVQLLHAALAVACGYSALDTMAEAGQDRTLSPALRNRMRLCAHTLNRTCQQNTRLSGARLACDRTGAKKTAATQPATQSTVTQDAATTQQAGAADDVTPEQAAEIMRRAEAAIAAYCNRPVQPSTPTVVDPGRNDYLAHLSQSTADPSHHSQTA